MIVRTKMVNVYLRGAVAVGMKERCHTVVESKKREISRKHEAFFTGYWPCGWLHLLVRWGTQKLGHVLGRG